MMTEEVQTLLPDRRTALDHAVVWFGLLAVILLIELFSEPWDQFTLGQSVFRSSVLVLCLFIQCATAFVILDHLKGLAFQAVFLVLSIVGLSLLIAPVLEHIGYKQGLAQDLQNFAITVFVAIAVRAAARGIKAARAQESAEHKALSAQLAPHTLYNMLNTVYDATINDPPRASQLVLQLSDMMRHLTRNATREYAPASEEWSFIEAYADFAKDRTALPAIIDLSFEGDPEYPLPAMVTATLFENAVKHALQSAQVEIMASLKTSDAGFLFHVVNKFDADASPPKGLGVGQKAVRRKLRYLYGNKANLDILIERNCYSATVTAKGTP